ncbi:SH3 domain-containing protein [Roseobacter weihaiensis]|uniref:SH3 domain-containing protein n=1 Tax=Roseobacter weihaiensis TaxID=2763262 RepID=UPI001D09DDFE|nr:SH3 domain-containing protein [Roseobacter sp. H9]
MKRFILLSFLFMGLGFYELSGGADFDPEVARLAAIDARQDREIARKAAFPAVNVAAAKARDTHSLASDHPDTGVTRARLGLISFDAVMADRATPESQPDTSPAPAEVAAPPDQLPIAALADVAAQQDQPLSLAALEATGPDRQTLAFSGTSRVATSTAPTTRRDIRSINGTHVNVRSGPGTSYDVVDQLTQSTQVEILSDAGNGWVELRPLTGGPSGWVAAFLLTNG